MNQLKQKNPLNKKAEFAVLLQDATEQLHPIIFDAIEVKTAAVKARGRAGLDVMKEVENNFDNKTVQQQLHGFIYRYC